MHWILFKEKELDEAKVRDCMKNEGNWTIFTNFNNVL